MSPSARKKLLAIQKDKLKNKYIKPNPSLYQAEMEYFQHTQYFNHKKVIPPQVPKEYQIRQNSKIQIESKETIDGHRRHFSSIQTQRNSSQSKTSEIQKFFQAQRGMQSTHLFLRDST